MRYFLAKAAGVPIGLLFVLGVTGCANDPSDWATTASTAASTAYLVGREVVGDEYAQAREFADANRVALARDAARGAGENLNAFAALMGQPDQRAFGRWMQANYPVLFPDAPAAEPELVSRIVALQESGA